MKAYYKGEEVELNNSASDCDLSNLETWYEHIYPDFDSGYFWAKDGLKKNWNEARDWKTNELVSVRCVHTVNPIEVYPNRKLKLGLTRMLTSNVPSLVFYDKDMNLVSYEINKTGEYDYVVPSNAYYMHVNIMRADGEPYIKLERYGKDLSPIDNLDERKKLLDDIEANHRNFLASKKDMKPNEKAYIIIRVDDGLTDLSLVHTIFSEKNIPICSSFIRSNLYRISKDDRSMLRVLKDIIEDGGEVCTHNSGPLTINNCYDFENVYHWFRTSKYILSRYGIEANGIMSSGGKDSQGAGGESFDHDYIEMWSAYYYSYSMGYGNGVPYILVNDGVNIGVAPPKDVQGFMEFMKGKINNAIENKEVLLLLMHNTIPKASSDTSYTDENCLRALAEYISTLDSNQIEVTTFKEYYTKHYYE